MCCEQESSNADCKLAPPALDPSPIGASKVACLLLGWAHDGDLRLGFETKGHKRFLRWFARYDKARFGCKNSKGFLGLSPKPLNGTCSGLNLVALDLSRLGRSLPSALPESVLDDSQEMLEDLLLGHPVGDNNDCVGGCPQGTRLTARIVLVALVLLA